MAGLALLCACKGRSSTETSDSATMDTTRAKSVARMSDTIQDHPKQVKTADIRFQVNGVRQTAEQITSLTASFNGTVVHHFMKSTAGDSVDVRKNDDSVMRVTIINSTAEMTVKIPFANMENFMNQVARLGIRVNNQRMDITDKSLEYLSARLKLKNQKDALDRQKEAANKKDPDNLLAVKNSMVDQQINNQRTDDSVKNSIVTLSFYEKNIISKKMVANSDLSAYREPLSSRLGTSFKNGWNVFTDVMAALANFWVLVPVGLGVWLGMRYYKNRKASALAKVD